MTAEKPKSNEMVRAIEKRWTKTVVASGWTAWPNILLERQQALGLDPLDMNILLHLARYWWEAEELPYPSISTIADAIGVYRSTDPEHYLRHVLERIADHPINRVAELLPWNIAAELAATERKIAA